MEWLEPFTVPEGCLSVGELITRLVEFGNMGAPVLIVGPDFSGWLREAEDDLGKVVMLHVEAEVTRSDDG